MSEAAQPIISITTPNRSFESLGNAVSAVAVFPDGRRMVTGSDDGTIHLWNLKDGVELKKMKGHRNWVGAVAVSVDGKLIASGDNDGKLIVWDGDTSEAIQTRSIWIKSLDFSPAHAVLATGCSDKTAKLWSTKTWEVDGNPIRCRSEVTCIRYSSSGSELAIATDHHIGSTSIILSRSNIRQCCDVSLNCVIFGWRNGNSIDQRAVREGPSGLP
jgi:WD40 repeat protein